MGKIRDRMLAEMELRGMAVRTQDTYLMCCRQFVGHFMRSPEQLGAAETKAFILHLIRERHASPSSVGVHVAAIRFLYRVVLRNPEAVEDLPRPKVPVRLPVVPSRDEVKRLSKAVRSSKYRTILTIAYGAGLRVSEVCRLQVPDIDSEQMVLRIRGGQGRQRSVGTFESTDADSAPAILGRGATAEVMPVSGAAARDAHHQGCGTQGPQVRGQGCRPDQRPVSAFPAARICHPSSRGWRGHSGRAEHSRPLACPDDGPLRASDDTAPGQGEEPSRSTRPERERGKQIGSTWPRRALPRGGRGGLASRWRTCFAPRVRPIGTDTSRRPSNAK